MVVDSGIYLVCSVVGDIIGMFDVSGYIYIINW